MYYFYNKDDLSFLFKKELCDDMETTDKIIVTEEFFAYPVLKNGVYVEADRMDLFNLGLIKLNDGEKVVDGVIVEIPEPCNFIVNKWDGEKWVEGATEEEIQESLFKDKIKFYNDELRLVSKANVELVCGIIAEDVFEEVKTYMKSIDPYTGIKVIPEVKRPEILKRYL